VCPIIGQPQQPMDIKSKLKNLKQDIITLKLSTPISVANKKIIQKKQQKMNEILRQASDKQATNKTN
jgi:hypothetical protein